MRLPSNWPATAVAREAKRQLTGIIEKEFADSRLFVIKDPRIPRLLLLWVELLQDLGIAPIVIIPFRNPIGSGGVIGTTRSSLAASSYAPLHLLLSGNGTDEQDNSSRLSVTITC